MGGGTDSGADFDALLEAGRPLDAARRLQAELPCESSDFAAELRTWMLDHADLERIPLGQRRDQWTRDQRKLRNRLLALRDAIAVRLRGRADAAALAGGDSGAGAPGLVNPLTSGNVVPAPPPAVTADGTAGRAGVAAGSGSPVDAALPTTGAPSVFISFSHCDRDVAEQVRVALGELGIRVRIDSEIEPGGRFLDYIERGIRETDCTLCILSKDSLCSDWVALETTLALSAGHWEIRRRLVGGYLDESFRDPAFQNQAIDAIDARIARLNAAATGALQRNTAIASYSEELERLHDLRTNLDKALRHFRSTLCLDLRPAARQASLSQLAALVRPPAGAR